MAKKGKPAVPVPVETIKHKDARTNIPTQELRGFVATEAERAPVVLYPRDPSLDPQLVWKGKDEQGAHPLEVRLHPGEGAPWFIDTNYNGESFFVRHAYFTGSDEPYEKLKRALRAEIDEGTWSTLYSTVSRPFAPPEHGRIAVKVINHYGDEVLKLFEE